MGQNYLGCIRNHNPTIVGGKSPYLQYSLNRGQKVRRWLTNFQQDSEVCIRWTCEWH